MLPGGDNEMEVSPRSPQGGAVAEAVTEQPMGYDAYLRLRAELRAEYVDGVARMSPPPSYAHQKICQRLLRELEDAVAGSGLDVVGGVGWELAAGARVRIPDIMVLAGSPDGPLVTEAPLVAVEVLSGNRSDDLVRKSTEYLEAGVGQYWVVDPRDRVLEVFANRRGWEAVARLDDQQPTARVQLLTGVGVKLDLTRILGRQAD